MLLGGRFLGVEFELVDVVDDALNVFLAALGKLLVFPFALR
jgi:hypothetical protein